MYNRQFGALVAEAGFGATVLPTGDGLDEVEEDAGDVVGGASFEVDEVAGAEFGLEEAGGVLDAEERADLTGGEPGFGGGGFGVHGFEADEDGEVEVGGGGLADGFAAGPDVAVVGEVAHDEDFAGGGNLGGDGEAGQEGVEGAVVVVAEEGGAFGGGVDGAARGEGGDGADGFGGGGGGDIEGVGDGAGGEDGVEEVGGDELGLDGEGRLIGEEQVEAEGLGPGAGDIGGADFGFGGLAEEEGAGVAGGRVFEAERVGV
jgi:hypothetical protein